MKAVVLTDYGGVDKLELRELPHPHPRPDAIVVRMAAAGINPIDWKVRSGAAKSRFPLEFPALLGRDVSGEVIEVGRDVTSFAVGDRVLGVVNGSYAEMVTAPAHSFAKVPPGLDLIEAGALPLVLLTGGQLIEVAAKPAEGSLILVTGAAGNVGRVAVFAAKMRGARVWAGVRVAQRGEAARLNTEGVVALDDDADIAKLPPLDAVADTIDGETIRKLYPKLKPGGVIGSVLGEPAGARERGLVVRAIVAQPDSTMLARLAAAVAERKLVIPIAKKMPLSAAREAQALAESGNLGGKVLLLG